jgi:hypothetical protein
MPAHEYRHAITGTPIPSVSAVIAQLRSSYRSRAIEEAAELGTLSHRLLERMANGDAVPDEDVPAVLAPTWAALQTWWFDREPVIERVPDGAGGTMPASELSLTTPGTVLPEGSYGGTIDLVVRLTKGGVTRRVLVDAKTRTGADGLPTPDRFTWAQLGGYAALWSMAYPDMPLDGGLVLVLGRDVPAYREAGIDRENLTRSTAEFLALRSALALHEARKVGLAAERKAGRKAGRAA